MNEDFSKYESLIKLMEETPKAPAPDRFTEKVMGRLEDEQRLSIWQLLRRTLAEAGEISWTRFTRECAQRGNACFYFFITGFFFFFIGSILFSSIFYIGYASRAMGFILMQALLVVAAATSLVVAGMMVAANMPGTARWAKRAIMLFGVLIIGNSMIINATIKTTSGGVLALTFGIAGIVTGVILMKALERRTPGNDCTFTGGLDNAWPK